MAKKSAAQPDTPATLATAGGSYIADEAAGAVQQDGPAEAPPRSRRGFGSPQSGIPTTQSAGEPDAAGPAATSATAQE